jgi:hypothetical protein
MSLTIKMLNNCTKNFLRIGSTKVIDRKYAIKTAYCSTKNKLLLEKVKNDPNVSPQERADAVAQLNSIKSIEQESGASSGLPHPVAYYTAEDSFNPQQEAQALGSITHHAPSGKDSFNCSGQLGSSKDHQEAVIFKKKEKVSEKAFNSSKLEAPTGSAKEKELLEKFEKKD